MGVEAKTTTFEVGQIDPFLTFAMARSALASAGSGDKSDSHAQARHRPGDVAAKVSPVIRLRNVTIEYDHHPAVHPSSEWRLRGGQHEAIADPNGAGKSTLLKALIDELTLTSGSIERGSRATYLQMFRHNVDEPVGAMTAGR